MLTGRHRWCDCRYLGAMLLVPPLFMGLSGCSRGACCEPDGACNVVTAAECAALGGRYLGDGTDCDDSITCTEDVTVFSYTGGDCPPELTVKDGDPGNVECGVPRSRLFDEDSPLDGSAADDPVGGFGTFPGGDDADTTGMLVRLDGFAVDPGDGRANIVVICLNIVIPPQAGGMRAVKCRITRAAGFKLTPEAQAVVNSGKRNYWAQQARKLAKLEADAAGGVDPRAARRADRLRRRFQRKNNRDYEVLVDGTRYMAEMTEETEKIEIDPPTPGAILTIYLVFVGDAFSSLGEFIPHLEVMLSAEPDADSPLLGNIEDNALVLESVDEVGPATVVDFANGLFDPNQVDVSDPANMNGEYAIWITNSSESDLVLNVPDHPSLSLPPDYEVAFNDLSDGGQITGQYGPDLIAALNVTTGGLPTPVACCIDGLCSDEFTSESGCFDAGGTPFLGMSCNDVAADACVPAVDLGDWTGTPGDYELVGDSLFPCQDEDSSASLVVVGPDLVLRGFEDNDDIRLMLEGSTATASNVRAFGMPGHTLFMQTQGDGSVFVQLQQPDTGGQCFASMNPHASN